MKLGSKIGIGSALGLPLILGTVSCKDQTRKPNVLFILVDDMGYRDLSYMGSEYYETPNIDQLAKEGMIFTAAYSNAPNSAPSRACILSGKYSPRHGMYTVGTSERGKSANRKIVPTPNKTILDSSFYLLPEAFRDAGYRTAHMGKWHMGSENGTGPEGQGCDVNIGGCHWGHPKSYFSPYKNKFLEDGPVGEYLTDRISSEAIKFINTDSRKPFFLYLSYYAVHSPIQPKKELAMKYREKEGWNGQNNPGYAAMIENLDWNIGRITKNLKEQGLDENTLIIFFSDNGGVGGITNMSPLSGSKGMLYEGGIREPMFVRWPGKIEESTECHVPIIGLDFYPTLLDICEMEKPDSILLDGVSLKPLFFQKGQIAEREIYWHFPAYLEGNMRSGQIWRTTPAGAISNGRYKLIEFFEDSSLFLFDIQNDIGESTNLSDSLPDIRDELYSKMLKWRKELQAPVPCKHNPEYQDK